jgi:hypothetical protein
MEQVTQSKRVGGRRCVMKYLNSLGIQGLENEEDAKQWLIDSHHALTIEREDRKLQTPVPVYTRPWWKFWG